MNITRILTTLTCGACLSLSLLAATPEEVAKQSATIIPKFELRDATPAEAFKAITAASGLKIVYLPPKDDGNRITVSLSNIPAGEALKYVTGLANLIFSFDKDGVVVGPNANKPVLEPFPPGFVVQPAPGAAAPVPEQQLITSEFRINAETFVRNLRRLAPPKANETDDLLLARYLKGQQAQIQSLSLEPAKGSLMIKATQADLDKIRPLIQQIESGTPPHPGAR